MTTKEVAERYYELAQTNNWATVIEELFSPEATSTEPSFTNAPVAVGKEQILANVNKMSEDTEEMFGGYCTAPVVAGHYFSLTMGMDVKMKGRDRVNMEEVCVFKVNEGKIISQQFFY
jgi:hypothetical protein